MPRWLWLLPGLTAALWWPVLPYFASDDFIAMSYASDLGRVARDFIGPQYGATDVWLFYRPLITLSFWCDQLLGGATPFVGHLSNVLAHASSAMLVALIWRRFLPDRRAFFAGLLWGMMAGHVGSLAWIVGRVDSHTTLWCLLALWLCLRDVEAARRSWAVALATAAGLMSKELAVVVPPLCSWLAFLRARGALGARAAAAWRASGPAWFVLAVYLPFRLLVLGEIGGYDAGTFDAGDAARGLGSLTLDQLVPLRWVGYAGASAPGSVFLWAAAAPVLVAVAAAIARRPALVASALAAWCVALVPMANFLSQCDNPHNLRYQYLPSIALAGILAAGHRWLAPAVAIAWLWPLIAVRAEQLAADRTSADMHAEMMKVAPTAPAGPMFVGGLPHANTSGTAVQLHFGVDRMLRPPFFNPGVALYAWRPLLQRPEAVRLLSVDGTPFELSEGSTWWFPEPYALVRAEGPKPLPALPIEGDVDGTFDLTTPVLDRMLAEQAAQITSGSPGPHLTMPGVAATGFRVTIFTANGYLSCWCPNHAAPGAPDARLDFTRFFGGDAKHPFWTGPAAVTKTLDADIGTALVVPTTIDLEPTFPTLIEAGAFDLEKRAFSATHRARRLMRLRFDRSYPDWVRRCMGR